MNNYNQAIIDEILEMAEALPTNKIQELIDELVGVKERSELSQLKGLIGSLSLERKD